MAEDKGKHIHIYGPGEEPEESKAECSDEKCGTADEKTADAAGGSCKAEGKAAGNASDEKASQEEASGQAAGTSDNESGGADSGRQECKEGSKEDSKSEGSGDKKSDDKKSDDKLSADQAAEQESERYMRLMAEFQNYKRRAAKEKSDIHAYANEKIIGELLPVLDNFERALATDPTDIEGYVKGMDLIFTQLKTALEHAGLTEIPALGEEFDPNVHNAVMTEESEEHDDGKVSRVLQKGYKLNDRVIRPSMVAVSRK